MRRRRLTALSVGLAALVSGALAIEPDEKLADPALEARAREISRELRCVVCQSQSIDDSNAPLARDLRLIVRERLQAGDSDGEVIDYVVDRYGEYVLLKPRFDAPTALLWLTPMLALAGAGFAALAYARSRRQAPTPAAALTAEEEEKLRELMTK